MSKIPGVAEDIVLKSDLLDYIYPIGSYYWNSNLIDPSDFFGGTWEQIKDKFVLAAGNKFEAGTTGGEAEHILSSDEMPAHWHKISMQLNGINYKLKAYYSDAAEGEGWTVPSFDGASDYQEGDVYAATEGKNQPHNNMPPYEVAYCWKRIA